NELGKIGFDKVQRFMSSQAADAGATAPLLAGNTTMMLDGQWRVKQAKDFGPQVRYAVLPMPAPKGCKGPASITSANYLLIPKAGKCPKGAWEFIKYWIGFDDHETGAKNMAEMGWLPYGADVVETATYQKFLREYPQYATFVKLMYSPYLVTQPVGPYQAYVVNQLTKVDESVSRGTDKPVSALDKAQHNIDVEVRRQKRLAGAGP
ncbi:MAG: extracellular solute-binding protein, partial [Armatimonadetes bacterium]|nr:extracellular solute-binding protein [Armatimonadota bacterium]